MNPDELPDFPLAPWELPPDSTEPLVAPATMRLRCSLWGRMADWLVRVVPTSEEMGELFVRAEADGGLGNWWFGFFSLHVEPLQEVNGRLRCFRKLHSAHQVRLYQEQSNGYVDVQEKHGNIHVFGVGSGSHLTPFAVQWPFDLTRAHSSQVHAEVRQLWQEDDSPLRFAWRWPLLSSDEQMSILLSWKRGGVAQLCQAMKLALKALASRYSSSKLEWTYLPASEMWMLREWSELHQGKIIQSEALEVWERGFLDVFGPCWNDELREKHLCAYYGPDQVCASVERPSFHEQLEAAHQLNAWLDEREAQNQLSAPLLAQLRATLH